MKTKILISFSLLMSNIIFAQKEYLYLVPIKSKIKSFEIFNVIGENLSKREISIDKSTYDNINRIISKKINTQRGSIKQEKNIYKENLIISYECKCEEIDNFITNFTIRDKIDLKNKINSSSTGNEPTKFVFYNYLDKKGNIISSAKFSENGYKTSETKISYNEENKITNKSIFDFYDKQTSEEIYEYDKKGNLTKRVLNDLRYSNDLKYNKKITDLYKYDNTNFQYENLTYYDDNLYTHFVYSKIISKGKEEVYKTDNVKNLKNLHKEIFYNSKNIIIETNEYYTIGTVIKKTEKKYNENGILTSVNYFENEINILNHIIEYLFDSKKNWTEIFITKSYPNEKDREQIKEKYIRKIDYLK